MSVTVPSGAGLALGAVAVVTGAGSGIGRALALSLASRVDRLFLVGRRSELLQAVAHEAQLAGADARACSTDLTADTQVHALSDLIRGSGGADVLVHSAGILIPGSVRTGSISDMDSQYRTNVRGPILLTQLLLPALIEQRGQVVFVNSSAGLSARAGVVHYSATKHALKAFADGLREEVNPQGVRVLSVYPGRTATPLQESIFAAEGRAYRPDDLLQPEDIAETILAVLLLPRSAEVTDVYLRPMKSASPAS
jgi:NADP-dependent 3-hydroxy acid dehydrogenase YdfG